MNYSHHASRLQLPDPAAARPPQKLLSLEPAKRGFCLRVRTAATMARRELEPYRLPVAAGTIAAAAFLAPVQDARAQLGYDPFAGNVSHTEESWATYSDASLGGTNRPTSTAVNGINTMLANATAFNFDVTAPTGETAFITGGRIYSFADQLTLTLTSTYAPAVGSFNTVVFSLKALGNPLNTAGVLLTPNGGQAIAPIYTSIATSGSGMGATAQYAFQFNLAGIGGSNNFTIAVPASASSVSYANAQLDETTTVYGAQNVVPEPSSLAFMAAAGGGLMIVVLRRRRLS